MKNGYFAIIFLRIVQCFREAIGVWYWLIFAARIAKTRRLQPKSKAKLINHARATTLSELDA